MMVVHSGDYFKINSERNYLVHFGILGYYLMSCFDCKHIGHLVDMNYEWAIIDQNKYFNMYARIGQPCVKEACRIHHLSRVSSP